MFCTGTQGLPRMDQCTFSCRCCFKMTYYAVKGQLFRNGMLQNHPAILQNMDRAVCRCKHLASLLRLNIQAPLAHRRHQLRADLMIFSAEQAGSVLHAAAVGTDISVKSFLQGKQPDFLTAAKNSLYLLRCQNRRNLRRELCRGLRRGLCRRLRGGLRRC